MLKRTFAISCLGFAVIAAGLVAQEKKAEKKGGPAVLQPQMKAETGSFSAPHGKLGEKPKIGRA